MAKLRRYRRDVRGRFSGSGGSAGKTPVKARSDKARENKRSKTRAKERAEGTLQKSNLAASASKAPLKDRMTYARADRKSGQRQERFDKKFEQKQTGKGTLKKYGNYKASAASRFEYGGKQKSNVARMQLKELERERRSRLRKGSRRGGK
jgi:hypothetical protein